MMKKITLLLLIFAFSTSLWAQIQTYDNLGSFETAYTSDLNIEDFSGGPTDPSICGTGISSAGDDCFAAGELIDGFVLSAGANGDVVLLPAGFLPSNNPSPRMGANAGTNFSLVSFTGPEAVYAAGFSIHVDDSNNFNYRVYDASDALIYDEVVTFSSFYGVISSTAISRVEIEGVNNAGELIGDLKFGTENVLSVEDHLITKVSFYPNPVKELLYFNTQNQATNVSVFNLAGQKLGDYMPTDGTLDMRNLVSGMYLLKMSFENGQTETLKVVKQ